MPEILRGDLQAVGLSTVLQAVEAEGLTGKISVPRGEIEVHMGNVVSARVANLGGIDALMELFLQPGGTFVVHTAEVVPAVALGPLTTLVLDGCRLLDEWQRIAASALLPTGTGPLPATLARLTPHLDGRTAIRDGVTTAGEWRCRVIDPLIQALEDGRLSQHDAVVSPAAAPAPPVDTPTPGDDTSFDATIDTARRLVREGRLGEARAAFERALVDRPNDRIALQNLRRLAALEGV
ncbi:MAG: DUF4388 domain-containing protein [Myxococcota bacterium]